LNLLLAMLLLSQVPAPFSPSRVGIRYAPGRLASAENQARQFRWCSPPGATVAQSSAGMAGLALTVGTGYWLFMGTLSSERYDDLTWIASATATAAPTLTTVGVIAVGCGRGNVGRAFLGSYLGEVALGGVGALTGCALDGLRGNFSGGSWMVGLATGAALGAITGAVVGYNLR
jgi:hypothetical protein